MKENKAKTTEELEAAQLKQAVEEDGTGGLLGRISEKMDKRRLQDGRLEPPPELPDIDLVKDRDEELYDLEFNNEAPAKKDDDPDAIPSLFP